MAEDSPCRRPPSTMPSSVHSMGGSIWDSVEERSFSDCVLRMLRSAKARSRGALLIRGHTSRHNKMWIPALRSSANSAAPRPGHEITSRIEPAARIAGEGKIQARRRQRAGDDLDGAIELKAFFADDRHQCDHRKHQYGKQRQARPVLAPLRSKAGEVDQEEDQAS